MVGKTELIGALGLTLHAAGLSPPGLLEGLVAQKRREVEISRLLDDAQRLIDTANAPIFGVDKNMNVPPEPARDKFISFTSNRGAPIE